MRQEFYEDICIYTKNEYRFYLEHNRLRHFDELFNVIAEEAVCYAAKTDYRKQNTKMYDITVDSTAISVKSATSRSNSVITVRLNIEALTKTLEEAVKSIVEQYNALVVDNSVEIKLSREGNKLVVLERAIKRIESVKEARLVNNTLTIISNDDTEYKISTRHNTLDIVNASKLYVKKAECLLADVQQLTLF